MLLSVCFLICSIWLLLYPIRCSGVIIDVHREASVTSKHQEVWSVSCSALDTGVIGHTQFAQIFIPLIWLVIQIRGQHTQESSVECRSLQDHQTEDGTV